MSEQSPRVLWVTGPSGAGRKTAINALEDLGYEVIDNLPLRLLPSVMKDAAAGDLLALGLDVRNRDFSMNAMLDALEDLARNPDSGVQLLYLDARADVLQRRYSETRRRHPLSPAESAEVGIERELDLLAPIRARADILLDTSELTPHELKAEIERQFAVGEGGKLAVSVQSFSFKRGTPRGIDMIFDARFLRNPYWEPALRAMNGQDQAVVDYIAADPRYNEFFDRVRGLVEFLLPQYAQEGKSYLSIGFGCTGGQHRSVALAENLSKALATAGWQVSIRHRELERQVYSGPAKGKMGKA
ncbi:RNase adapter RapZ [Donghicola mangrovi]|uniref:RNase adapter RapZ n=1 Tax=Donghicola mangrovi TaxID=2729614 RepID=A0A850Q5X9_9RHOB|nr:RNase adapter RapZ [Donghicola mangrovi]NVO24526.1 RNase adapter RapZ [Donghicola mangrovi]